MKKLLSLALLCFTIYQANAQTAQGNMMIGGSFSVGSTSYEGSPDKYNTFTFAPSFGFFVADNLAVGTGISFTQNSTVNGLNKNDYSSFGISPFARYYKFTSNDKFAFYAQGTLGIGSYRNETGSSVSKGTNVSFSVAPGFSYFFTNRWGMDLGLSGLTIASTNPNGAGNNTSGFSLNLSLSPSLGLRYYFGK